MMQFLSPGDLASIQNAHSDLCKGLTGTNVIVHWYTQSGVKDDFGRWSVETPQTLLVRCYVDAVSGRNITERAADKTKVADVQTGNMSLLFTPDVDLTNKPGMWFEIAGFGNFEPDAKPPTGAMSQDVLNPSGMRFTQQIYVRPKR